MVPKSYSAIEKLLIGYQFEIYEFNQSYPHLNILPLKEVWTHLRELVPIRNFRGSFTTDLNIITFTGKYSDSGLKFNHNYWGAEVIIAIKPEENGNNNP